MIEIAEARQLIEQHAPEPEAVLLAIEAAHGMVLAQDILSREDSPRFDNSAMDGYCLRWQDVDPQRPENSAPAALRIIGESSAGKPFDGKVQPGTAVRISTGATVPRGGDTVIPQEDCTLLPPGAAAEPPVVQIKVIKKAGVNIRHRAEEFAAGSKLLSAGSVLDAANIGILAGQGYATVAVRRRLRVAAIVTGSELQPHWQPDALAAGQLRDSNGPMLRALIAESSAVALPRTHAVDSMAAHNAALAAALKDNADVIVFSGGVSVGPHDLVRECARQAGFEEVFWRVNQKPGKPMLFAQRSTSQAGGSSRNSLGNVKQLLFGLPGNPVSAHVCFTVYIRPLLLGAAGMHHRESSTVQAGEALYNTGKRPVFMRLQLREEDGIFRAFAAEHQGSHMLSGVTQAAALTLLPAGGRIAKGAKIEVQRF